MKRLRVPAKWRIHVTPRCMICPRRATHARHGLRWCELHTPAWVPR